MNRERDRVAAAAIDAGAKPVDVPSTDKLESFNAKKAETKSETQTGIVSFGDF
jgi:hypothetical protein